MMNFATRAGWRYFRNTWATATLGALLLASSCSLAPRPAFAADAAPHNPIFVFVAWLKPLAHQGRETTVEIVGTEFAGIAPSPGACASLPMIEVLKPLKDVAERLQAGLTPVVICGVAAPTQDAAKPPVRSEPGHPDQPQGPSGAL